MRGLARPRGGVLRWESLRGAAPAMKPDRAGSTATAPGIALADFFLLEGGMSDVGKVAGTGSFSMARYTRCIAWKMGGKRTFINIVKKET